MASSATSSAVNNFYNNNSFAQKYSSAEKITGPFAGKVLEQAGIHNINPSTKLVIQDNACGTGVLTVRLMNMLSEESKRSLDLVCTDKAEAMVDIVNKRIEDSGWKGVKAMVADAQDTQLPSSHYTHIFTVFGIMLFPDSGASLRESYRMLQPSGLLALTTWKEVGWYADHVAAFELGKSLPALPPMETMTHAMSFDPNGPDWHSSKAMESVFRHHGFVDVDVREVALSATMDHIDEYLEMMPGMMKMILSRIWSADEMGKYYERALAAISNYLKGKYGDRQVSWDWVANLGTERKA